MNLTLLATFESLLSMTWSWGWLVVKVLLLTMAWRFVKSTTLVAPLIWLGISCCGLSLANYLGAIPNDSIAYCAGCCTLLPAMAVLGAKRPQDQAWQCIVFALGVVLLLPVAEVWLINQAWNLRDERIRIWFLVILIVVQWTNWCITRQFLAVTTYTAGQVLLLWSIMPWNTESKGLVSLPTACWFITLGLLVAWWIERRALRSHRPQSTNLPTWLHDYHRQWIDFRSWYGVVWGLRVQERINEVARLQQWPFELNWSGFVMRTETTDDLAKYQPAVEQIWQNVLRRFVSQAWMDVRKANAAPASTSQANAKPS
jgi:hypothetical protein